MPNPRHSSRRACLLAVRQPVPSDAITRPPKARRYRTRGLRLPLYEVERRDGCVVFWLLEETRKVNRSRRRLSLPQTGHLAMLELVGSLSAAFLSELGTAELIVGLLFAAGLVGCAVQGRDCEHSGPTRPAR
jgi:hypothetical protein